MNVSHAIQFELHTGSIAHPVRVRLDDFADRWVASVECGPSRTAGLGASAREALVAALAPLGGRASGALMASPTMFAASAQLLAARSAG